MASRPGGRRSAAAAGPLRESSSDGSAERQLQSEVEERFGVLPNFFRLAAEAPEITAKLWEFARFAYLDNPLPAVFKERLFVYLSRFCEVRYCIVRHLGFLVGLRHPAGDHEAPAQTVEQALGLLERRLPRGDQVELHVARCTAADAPLAQLPPPDSEMEVAIFTCAAHVFLQSAEAPACLEALERVLGGSRFQYLTVFLSFVQTAHFWTRVHTELEFEEDVSQLMAADELLADRLLNDPEAGSGHVPPSLMEELEALRQDKEQRRELARAIAAGRETEGLLRRSNEELTVYVAEARDARRAALNLMEDAIEAKDALKNSEKRLLEADRRKDEFLATLAHELRNPLAPIRNSVQIMRLPNVDSDVAEQARETIERQVTHLVRLVDDLLDVSRISRNKFELRKDRVALGVIVQSAIETSRPLIEASGQELTVKLPSRTLWLDADLTRLAQSVANLLNNAAKYTPRGGHILLSAERHGKEAVMRVRDTGIGIPDDMLPHIFEMFRQVDTSHERSQGGLGIGLTLVKNLVEMHGGTVEAHSDGVGRGSEFVIRLPVAEENSASSGNRIDGKFASMKPRRILVVDDNRDSADSLALLLSHSGHDLRTAYDGIEAIQMAADFEPEVILLDIGMPKLNGYEVARRIREQPWGAAIMLIALTGWGQAEDRSKSQAAGFNEHLVKPVEHAALTKLLNDLSSPA